MTIGWEECTSRKAIHARPLRMNRLWSACANSSRPRWPPSQARKINPELALMLWELFPFGIPLPSQRWMPSRD